LHEGGVRRPHTYNQALDALTPPFPVLFTAVCGFTEPVHPFQGARPGVVLFRTHLHQKPHSVGTTFFSILNPTSPGIPEGLTRSPDVKSEIPGEVPVSADSRIPAAPARPPHSPGTRGLLPTFSDPPEFTKRKRPHGISARHETLRVSYPSDATKLSGFPSAAKRLTGSVTVLHATIVSPPDPVSRVHPRSRNEVR